MNTLYLLLNFSYNNPLEPVFKGFYSYFLKANNQDKGIDKMSKETQNIDLAESKALNIPVFMWRFCAYKTEKDYESGEHYFVKDFLKHHKMKNYSAKHSKKEKPRHADYCSMYWKIEC